MILIPYYEKECWVINNCIGFVTHALDKLNVPYEMCHGHDVLLNFREGYHKTVMIIHPTSQILQDIAKYGFIQTNKIWWDFEAPYEIDTIVQGASAFNKVFTFCKNSASYLLAQGIDTTLLPTASDITVFRPIIVEPSYFTDVLFLGNAFPSRIEYFRKYDRGNRRVVIIGVGYPQDIKDKYEVKEGIIPPSECAKWYNGAKEVIQIQRTIDDADLGQNKNKIVPDLVPIRNWDIQACKTQSDKERYKISFEKLIKDNILPLL